VLGSLAARIRHEEVTSVTGTFPGVAPPGSRYGDQRPYVVPERLGDLHGPTSGVVELEPHLDWSGKARFDLDNPRRLASLYETVLREATSPADLHRWLDQDTLIRLWPTLVLPPQLRARWQARFPQLTGTGDLAA
jgi:hypothetical protein